MSRQLRTLAIVFSILLPTWAGATQYVAGSVTSTSFSVALTLSGQKRLYSVEATLSDTNDRIAFLAVRSESGLVKIPADLVADLEKPDLGTLALTGTDSTVRLALRYGNQSPAYFTGDCSFADTRYMAIFEIRNGKVADRSFFHYEDGPLDPQSGSPPNFSD